ncbi:hypothetical protein [Limnohabitans sp. Rim8]|uniref:hypothetical protein n=1 Tax=Limnohabitans sp. Rim8 TaxID=1100718 RepID=UPI00330601CD
MNLRRISGVLILAVLLKVSAALASPTPHHGPIAAPSAGHALPACDEHQAHPSAETPPKLDAVDTSTASQLTCSPWDDCQNCCAVGLGMNPPQLAHKLPSAAPMRAWTNGTSLSPRPGLRPPIA